MKTIKQLLLCILMLILLINPIIANESASISIDSDGYITFNVPNFTSDDLLYNESYYTMITFDNGSDTNTVTLNSITSVDDILLEYRDNVTITIKIYDAELGNYSNPDATPEYGSFTFPASFLTTPTSNNYEFVLDDSSLIDTIEITGNELSMELFLVKDSLPTLINQESNKITISKDCFKDFSNLYDTYSIAFVSNGNVVTTITNLKLTSDILKKSLVNKTFNISNDTNNIYVDIDDSEYFNNITYIHVYGVDDNNMPNSYTIGDHIGYGIDANAYDLTSVKSLVSLIPIDNQKPLVTLDNPLSIPVPDFYNKYPKLGIDIYANGYVTLHKFYKVTRPSKPAPSNNEEIREEENKDVEVEHIHKVPDTGVK